MDASKDNHGVNLHPPPSFHPPELHSHNLCGSSLAYRHLEIDPCGRQRIHLLLPSTSYAVLPLKSETYCMFTKMQSQTTAPYPSVISCYCKDMALSLLPWPSINQDLSRVLHEIWAEYTATNSIHRNNPNLFWGKSEAILRGGIVSFAVTHKKKVLKNYCKVSDCLHSAQFQLMHANSPTNRNLWHEAKHNFDPWADTQEQIHKSHIELKYHKFGNDWKTILAKLCKSTHIPTHISALKDTQGTLTPSTKDVTIFNTVLCLTIQPIPNIHGHCSGVPRPEPSSYRPISLLNLDSKILSKIIASRLAKQMPSLVHPSQAGFTQGCSASSNIRKVITDLEHAKANPAGDFAIISLDTEKAFDKVRFTWLSLVL